MKYSIDKLPNSNEPFTEWGNTLIEQIKINQLTVGTDIKHQKGTSGTRLSLPSKYKHLEPSPHYMGDWSVTGSYRVGDVVRVLPDVNYLGVVVSASLLTSLLPTGSTTLFPIVPNDFGIPWSASGAITLETANELYYPIDFNSTAINPDTLILYGNVMFNDLPAFQFNTPYF